MNRTLIIAALALAPLSATAQQAQAPAATTTAPKQQQQQEKVVAVINGEMITQEKFDRLWERIGTQMRGQYESAGGKTAFLENYLRKRLLVQEALKAGFEKRPEVIFDMEAAKESALFDRYIRDVVAPTVVSEAEVRKYYDEHPAEFETGEAIKVRHIVVVGDGAGPKPKSKEQAMATIKQVADELRQQMTFPAGTDQAASARIALSRFSAAATRFSEDGAAPSGGDLGWVERGKLDPTFEAAAFALQPGTMSDIVETRFGYHLIFLEGKRPAAKESYESVKKGIREFLTQAYMPQVMEAVTRLTNELRQTSKVAVYPENIK